MHSIFQAKYPRSMIAVALCFLSTSTLWLRLWVYSIPSVMDVSLLTSLPFYGLDVTVDMLTTWSDVKFNADNTHISFGSCARSEIKKNKIRGQEHCAFLLHFLSHHLLCNPKSMMSKEYGHIAIALASGRLPPFVLYHLYRSDKKPFKSFFSNSS